MIASRLFGHMPDAQPVTAFVLTNANGCEIEILSLGGIIRRWLAPTAQRQDIVLGLDTVEQYLNDPNYFGALVGRYANRIGHGRFSIGETQYQLPQNQAGHCLHGGVTGFNHANWQLKELNETNNLICLSHTSQDGDQGFPGTLEAETSYQLLDNNCLRIEYRAVSDKDTLYNPTQHSYFNLAGHDSGDIKQHHIQVSADNFTPADETALPTGEILSVQDTPFDLRELKQVGEVLAAEHAQLMLANGLDHNFCLNDHQAGQTQAFEFAKVVESSGLTLAVRTNMPGAQVYTGNFIGSNTQGKGQALYQANQGLCIETQHYPDAPNKAHFHSALLKAGEQFYSATEYTLSH